MPHLSLFLERADVADLFATLSGDSEVAFLTEVCSEEKVMGVKRWRATHSMQFKGDGRIAIWHIPSGPVVVRNEKSRGPEYLVVETPFEGWNSPAYTNEPSIPLLGNKPQFFELKIEVNCARNPALLGLSSISWIGSHYEKSPTEAQGFWQRLQRLAKKRAKRVLGDGISSHAESTFLCWPAAFERIKAEQPSRVRA